jgi:hypothetical protein
MTRSHYERLLAEKLGVSESSVNVEIRKVGKTDLAADQDTDTLINEKVSLERYLLALIVQSQIVPKGLDPKELEDETVRKILELIIKEGSEFKTEELARKIPKELEEDFNEASLLELPSEVIKNDEKVYIEINSCVSRVKELNLRAKLKALSLSIRQAEVNKKTDEVFSLTKTFNVLSQELSNIEKVRAGEK